MLVTPRRALEAAIPSHRHHDSSCPHQHMYADLTRATSGSPHTRTIEAGTSRRKKWNPTFRLGNWAPSAKRRGGGTAGTRIDGTLRPLLRSASGERGEWGDRRRRARIR
jgi:hypothetical protein